MTPGLLNATELSQRLGLSRTTFYVWRSLGRLKQFETTRPYGQRKYSVLLVERYLAGQSTARIGTGARTA